MTGSCKTVHITESKWCQEKSVQVTILCIVTLNLICLSVSLEVVR